MPATVGEPTTPRQTDPTLFQGRSSGRSTVGDTDMFKTKHETSKCSKYDFHKDRTERRKYVKNTIDEMSPDLKDCILPSDVSDCINHTLLVSFLFHMLTIFPPGFEFGVFGAMLSLTGLSHVFVDAQSSTCICK